MTVHHKDLCPCGSGKRYKHCHLPIKQAQQKRITLIAVGIAVVAAGSAIAWTVIDQRSKASTPLPPSTTASSNGDVGANAFGGVQPGVAGRSPTPVQQGTTVSIPSGNAVEPGTQPKPWEYDVAKNRHFDPSPGHQHWHDGPPPATPGAASGATVTTTPGVTATTSSGAPVKITGTSSVQVAPSTPLAPGETPKPYEYDAVKNQYFDPAHNHWHPGKPPANAGGAATTP